MEITKMVSLRNAQLPDAKTDNQVQSVAKWGQKPKPKPQWHTANRRFIIYQGEIFKKYLNSSRYLPDKFDYPIFIDPKPI